MINPVYVLDTQALVWFTKGHAHKLGLNVLLAMLSPRARVVVPSYVLEEIDRKFSPRMDPTKDPAIPPAAILRLVGKCANARILPRGGATLAREFQLKSNLRNGGLDSQDLPIAAAALVARQYYTGPVLLVTCDARLRAWASQNGITVVWNQRPVEWLPG